jgi:hypothetical protein
MTKIMLILMLIGSAADLASTEYVLAGGGYEQNPLMENRAVRVAANFAAPVAAFFIFRNRPKWMGKTFFFIHMGTKTYATSRNIYIGVKIRW